MSFLDQYMKKNKIYSRNNDLIYEAKVRNMKKTIFDILELAKIIGVNKFHTYYLFFKNIIFHILL